MVKVAKPEFCDLEARSPFVKRRLERLKKVLDLDLPYPVVRGALELLRETGDEEAYEEASRRVGAYYRERGQKLRDELLDMARELGI